MSLLIYGINHKTAALELREQVAFQSEAIPEALKRLREEHAANEAVLLSTCNRTEVYAIATNREAVEHWLASQRALDTTLLAEHHYVHEGAEAIRHMMRVASGLDSMVLGEPQILGQMKQAYSIAQAAGTVGTQFQSLFPAIFASSKEIRSKTQIGAHPVSMAYAIVHLAKRLFSDLNQIRVLLIGAGETIELAATHLQQSGIHQLLIANRSMTNAERLAANYNARAICLTEIPNHLKEIDLLITATASPLPILGKGMVESALKLRKHRPILMADLAVPRDIEAEVGQLEDIYLYNVDDLQAVIEQNLKSRETAALQAETMINLQTTHYLQQLRVFNAADLITHYRSQVERLRDAELSKAMKRLEKCEDPQAVLASLAHNLSNKIMHAPTIKLRKAAYEGNVDLLNLSLDLLNLEISNND